MSEKITITRALGELKLLDSRIRKKTSAAKFVGLYQNKKDVVLVENVTKDAFTKSAEGDFNSIESLIERRKKIKSAILISNAMTKVKIGDEEYTVIEAIDRKNSIEYEKSLLDMMKRQLSGAKDQVERQKPQLDQSIQEMLKQNLGTEAKPTQEDYNSIAKPLLMANELNILDPCKVREKIDAMEDKIDKFLSDVDVALSESNSRTEIEI